MGTYQTRFTTSALGGRLFSDSVKPGRRCTGKMPVHTVLAGRIVKQKHDDLMGPVRVRDDMDGFGVIVLSWSGICPAGLFFGAEV